MQGVQLGRHLLRAVRLRAEQIALFTGIGIQVEKQPGRSLAEFVADLVAAEVEGDVHFPAFDESAWTEVRREEHPAGEGDDFPFVFRVLERR